MKAVRNTEKKSQANDGQVRILNRKPIVPTSPPTTVELRGVTIHFPFRPYQCQEDYMSKVLDALNHSENALLESPTGTGKTLCLLCSALAWQREQARSLQRNAPQQMTQETLAQANPDVPKKVSRVPVVIYASRTHSQLSQVVRELKNTRYRPKHALLGSREQMCVNPKVKKKLSTVSDINHDCNRLAKERKCRFRNSLEGFKPPPEPGANGTQPVMDMEDLVSMGTKRKVCPFYYTRSLIENAELILVPYNYLFDKDARETTMQDVPWNNSIVIFDESHNLESFASESASFDLSSVDIAGCILEIQKVVGYQKAMPELCDRVPLENLAKLNAIFLQLEEYILNKIPNDRSVFSGDYMMNVLEKGALINHQNHALFVNEAKKVSDIIMDMRSSSSKGQTKIDFFIGCVKRVFGESSPGRCLASARSYRVHVSPKPTGNNKSAGRTVSYWCFAPSLAMQELANLEIRSIIVTSGTLCPLPSFSMELGLKFPHTLENPHIITDDQIHVRLMGHGVSGKLLSSNYNRRSDEEYTNELGSTLVNLARVIPAGMLIFFPSYGVMASCIEAWGGPSRKKDWNNNKGGSGFFARRQSKGKAGANQVSFPHAPDFYGSTQDRSIWKRLLCQKAIVLEPKSTSELAEAIAAFHEHLDRPKSAGCILMGVCRGKISEGIDFSHDMCRAVVITGLPFAPFQDPKVKLKREYLDRARAGQNIKATGEGGFGSAPGEKGQAVTLSGMEWYQQQALRAVNQAIGRVIRNKYDYGAVLLLDNRFGEPRNKEGLSKWVRSRVLPDEKFGIAVSNLAKFYRGAKEKATELDAQRAAVEPAPSTNAGLVLAYENEPRVDELSINKVAVVRTLVGDTEGKTYIPRDDIITTLDIDRRQDSESKPTASQPNPVLNTTNLNSLYKSKATQSSSSSGTSSSKSVWASLKKPTTTSSEAASLLASRHHVKHEGKSTTPAQRFFSYAKQKLEPRDMNTFKRLLFAMKKDGDANDSDAFMKSAGTVMDILIKVEPIEKLNDCSKSSLFSLLFPLLPAKLVKGVQKTAIKKLLTKSHYFIESRKSLTKANADDAIGIVYKVLRRMFFLPTQEAISGEDFLQECSKLWTLLDRSLWAAFLALLPLRYKTTTKAFLADKDAMAKMNIVKAKEKAREGEGGLQVTRFTTVAKEHPQLRTKNETPEDIEQQRNMQAALMAAEQAALAKRIRVDAELAASQKKRKVNPYHSARPFTEKADNEQPKSSDKLTKKRSSNASGSRSTQPADDKFQSMLKMAASTPFVQGQSKPIVRSNSVEVNCTVCEAPSKKPIMAPCGHLACVACWQQWLKHRANCPVCRKPVEEKDLKQVFYQVKAEAPSLSQVCRNPDDSDSDDEELEIITQPGGD